MRGETGDEEVLKRVRAALEQSANDFPPDVLAGLRKGRIKAVELAEKRERRLLFLPRRLTAGAVAALSVLVVAVSLWRNPPLSAPQEKGADEHELVASAEQLELYDDLEFFLWLAERENAH